MSRHDDKLSLRQMLDHWEIVTTDFTRLAGTLRSRIHGRDATSDSASDGPAA